MKGSKLKIQRNGDIYVILPYKNGKVTWSLTWNGNYNFSWRVVNRPDNYKPERVDRAHKQYLLGKTLRLRIKRSAAASHMWWLLDKLKGVDDYRKREQNSRKQQLINQVMRTDV
ncbi:MAG: hypothetical protein CTY12_00805 [Methylotenera sp.]|nr:MAG: hypothetical protein CTY12_00805 [Methylotenera sp.]